jgi:hypothetical protein
VRLICRSRSLIGVAEEVVGGAVLKDTGYVHLVDGCARALTLWVSAEARGVENDMDSSAGLENSLAQRVVWEYNSGSKHSFLSLS